MLPEIVLFAHAGDMVGWHPDLFVPDIVGLVVLGVDGHIKPFGRDLEHLGEKFPCPAGRFSFKIIAKGKIAQHLKIGAMARSFPHPVDIGRADAFLAGGHPLAGRGYLAGKVFFHGRHACIDQQQGVVVLRDERKALEPQMPFALEKAQVFFTQVVESGPFHCHHPFL